MRGSAALPHAAAAVAVLLWSTSAAALSLAGPRLPGHVMLAWIYTLSSAFMLPILWFQTANQPQHSASSPRHQGKHLTLPVAATIFAYCILDFTHEYAFLLGTRSISPLRATLVNYLWPLWLAFLTYPLRRMAAPAKAAILLPLVLGFAGVAVFAFQGGRDESASQAPLLLGLVSSLCGAGYMAVFMHLAQRKRLGLSFLLTINFVVIAAGLWAADFKGCLSVISIPVFYPILLYLSLFTVVVPELLWAFFLKTQTGGASALPAFATPLLAAILLSTVQRQWPQANTIPGGIMILSSLLLWTFLRSRVENNQGTAGQPTRSGPIVQGKQ